MQSSNFQANVDADASLPQAQAPEQPRLEAPEYQYEPRSRMLRNLRGERGALSFITTSASLFKDKLTWRTTSVYIGGAASISFLQLIRDTVTAHIGPSQFSHNNKSDNMLETESPKEYRHAPPSPVTDPDLDLKLLYAQTYQAAVSVYLVTPVPQLLLVKS